MKTTARRNITLNLNTTRFSLKGLLESCGVYYLSAYSYREITGQALPHILLNIERLNVHFKSLKLFH